MHWLNKYITVKINRLYYLPNPILIALLSRVNTDKELAEDKVNPLLFHLVKLVLNINTGIITGIVN